MTGPSSEEFRFGIDLSPDYLIGLNGQVRTNSGQLPSGAQSLGGRVVNRAGQGQEVFDLRAFVDGDDVRHLDHRATARKGTAYVKRFHEERNSKLILALDLRPSMYFGIKRALHAFTAAEALALVGWMHVRNQGQVGLYAFTSKQEVFVPPRARDHAMLRVIASMCELYNLGMTETQDGEPTADLYERLSNLPRLAERGSSILIASSFEDAGSGIENTFKRLRHRNRLRCFCLANPDLADLPVGRYPVASKHSGRFDLSGFDTFTPPNFLDIAGGDIIIDASSDPSSHASHLAA